MPDHYSPKLFLQQIPKDLLRQFFTRRGELGDLDWDGLDDADVDPILNAWHVLPLPQQADIERWFRAISALATKEGFANRNRGMPISRSRPAGVFFENSGNPRKT